MRNRYGVAGAGVGEVRAERVGLGVFVAVAIAALATILIPAAATDEAQAADPTVQIPCGPYGRSSNGHCCNDHDCRSTYPGYFTVPVDATENEASKNPGGFEPPATAYDTGIPDPVDAALDDGGDGAAMAIVPALQQEGIDMQYVTVIDENSAVIEAAAAAGFQDCPRYYTCFWRHVHYRGRAYFARAGSDGYWWRNLRDFGLSDEISSWRNRRRYTTALARDIDGGGPRICLARFSNVPRMFYMNDKASSFKLTTQQHGC